MGVPVVTFTGQTHASRVGASLLRAVGADDCVCQTIDDYIATAVRLASDAPARDRESIRRAMARSPLCDEKSFVARFEASLRQPRRSS